MLVCLKIFLERNRELIRAGGAFESATDSREALDCFFNGHAGNKCRNSLRISGAASVINNVLDDTVVNGDVNFTGANTVSFVSKLGHVYFPF
jgi:hypothetical protein